MIQSSDEEVLACQTLTNGHEAGGEPLVSGIGDERGVFQKNRERLLSFRSEAAQDCDIRMLRAIHGQQHRVSVDVEKISVHVAQCAFPGLGSFVFFDDAIPTARFQLRTNIVV